MYLRSRLDKTEQGSQRYQMASFGPLIYNLAVLYVFLFDGKFP